MRVLDSYTPDDICVETPERCPVVTPPPDITTLVNTGLADPTIPIIVGVSLLIIGLVILFTTTRKNNL